MHMHMHMHMPMPMPMPMHTCAKTHLEHAHRERVDASNAGAALHATLLAVVIAMASWKAPTSPARLACSLTRQERVQRPQRDVCRQGGGEAGACWWLIGDKRVARIVVEYATAEVCAREDARVATSGTQCDRVDYHAIRKRRILLSGKVQGRREMEEVGWARLKGNDASRCSDEHLERARSYVGAGVEEYARGHRCRRFSGIPYGDIIATFGPAAVLCDHRRDIVTTHKAHRQRPMPPQPHPTHPRPNTWARVASRAHRPWQRRHMWGPRKG